VCVCVCVCVCVRACLNFVYMRVCESTLGYTKSHSEDVPKRTAT
jgi:hypothetical protein